MTRRILVVGFTILSIALQPNRLWAQWQYDGTPVATSLVSKSSPTILSDGNGGAFIAYHEVPYYPDIFLQRVNSTGKIQWTPKGVPIAVGGDYESPPKMVSDGGTGLILVWYDRRNFPNYDIYAQRVTASGVVQWTTNGVAICTATGEQLNPAITTDGSGGAIITWQDARSGTNDIYAQRINGSGVVQWAANGVVMCNATDSQQYPLMVYDGSGGAIAGWQDNRAGNMDVYAQRVNASGVMQWAANGVNQMTGSGVTAGQYLSAMTSDGAGGAIMTWQDYRYGNYDVFAGRVSPAGALLWTNFGAWLTAGGQDQLSTMIVSDGAGGAIVGWIDSGTDIFARRIDASGNPMWASEGVAVCAATGTQNTATMISDGLGGVVVAWQDSRSGTVDIYAQRMDASGIAQWTPNGVPVCTAPTSQSGAVIASK